jgi:hypothetical protein
MAMNNVQYWLTQLRHDAQQIVKMSDTQLKQAATLTFLDDMVANAGYVYAGQQDPNTNTMREGVTWIHDQMQTLANLTITQFKATTNGSSQQMVPGTAQPEAFVPYSAEK